MWTESPRRTPERRNGADDKKTTESSEAPGDGETVLKEIVSVGKADTRIAKDEEAMLTKLEEKMMEAMNVEEIDEETTRMAKRIVVLRISTKHLNLWMLQLELKRKEICELAGLLGFEDIKKEVETEQSLVCWARRCAPHFTKKTKRMLFEEIDNMVWSDGESEIAKCCKKNKVYDEITA